jgi:hypothetical protein
MMRNSLAFAASEGVSEFFGNLHTVSHEPGWAAWAQLGRPWLVILRRPCSA